MAIDISKIQSIITSKALDGWLLYDFRGMNELALEILHIPKASHLTRRFFYFIPANGTPTKIVNGIEADNLRHLPGTEIRYSSRESLDAALKSILISGQKIAMEYSPMNAIPYLSKLDAGTYQYLSGFGIDIICSGDLITLFNATWTKEQYDDNKPVAAALVEIVKDAFKYIKEKTVKGESLNEYEVQCFIMNEFERRNIETDFPPIVGVNENSANPHYEPTAKEHKPINKGDFVLIDLWAKSKMANAVWADITWCGYMGSEIPEKYIKIFNIVKNARDAAFDLVSQRFAAKQPVMGWELDNAARTVIADAGYAEYYIHRTGHSITTEVHGSGPHLDNFETKDERLISPSTSFSIEPGIYLRGDFGVRNEIDVFIHEDGKVEFTGPEKQEELFPILK